MAPNPAIMQAVEKLNYRVTVGDVAQKAGLNIEITNQGLLALATDAGGHLQVADTGDIVYLFPRNFRDVLRNKYFKLQLQEWWNKVWKVLFYLIRISFGIVLILSIALIVISITLILTSLSGDDDDRGGGFGGGIGFFYFPDLFWFFSPNYNTGYRSHGRRREKSDLNFLEAVFSFLFGDGNPNVNLEERRWQEIATVIRNNDGAVVAEQITPYLDNIGETYQQQYEDYMLPVLTKFNGKPEVSPEGEIVYYFPELQVSAKNNHRQSIPNFLREFSWRFSKATSSQVMLSTGLGVVNFVGALMLGGLLRDGTIAGGLVGFVQGIYGLLLVYAIGFLAIPLIRYFWVQWRNEKISDRNRQRQSRANLISSADEKLQKKIDYAHQFATSTVISEENLTYSTETDLIEQEAQRSEQIDAEWRKRLEEGNG
ncbi:hypothetical protein Riv7116_5365 [Rivularia sp. PCC 7116]|uniref:hypothetical protein n=1 Tax=Rivularia sp. PCC 7116 TaxID=373994 RepID=UPI00029EC9C8|nr:hypothetical protein [Rivularia sp. PCC 7116]AFY57744.1 hypothetical protein Riv7116_5365 [Rivularia sp. PCC 7116]